MSLSTAPSFNFFFFFSSRRRHTRLQGDWSSDVCSSDLGNHDRACSGMTDVKEFNPVAAISAYWTRTNLKPEHLNWLRDLPQGPLRHKDFPGMEFVHGSPLDEDEYLLTTGTADDNL